METDNGEDTGRPGTIGSVKIEWNWDLDNRWHEMKSIGSGDDKYTFGEEGRFRLKGRCRRIEIAAERRRDGVQRNTFEFEPTECWLEEACRAG